MPSGKALPRSVKNLRPQHMTGLSGHTPKTKAFASQLKTLGLTARTLIIVDESELDDNLILASRNLKDVLVVTPRFADPLCLIYFDKVVATKAAVAQIQEMLA